MEDKEKVERLRAAAIGLIGVDTMEEWQAMATFLSEAAAVDDDARAAFEMVRALIDTSEE